MRLLDNEQETFLLTAFDSSGRGQNAFNVLKLATELGWEEEDALAIYNFLCEFNYLDGYPHVEGRLTKFGVDTSLTILRRKQELRRPQTPLRPPTDRQNAFLMKAFEAARTDARSFDAVDIGKSLIMDEGESNDVYRVLANHGYVHSNNKANFLTPEGREEARRLLDEKTAADDAAAFASQKFGVVHTQVGDFRQGQVVTRQQLRDAGSTDQRISEMEAFGAVKQLHEKQKAVSFTESISGTRATSSKAKPTNLVSVLTAVSPAVMLPDILKAAMSATTAPNIAKVIESLPDDILTFLIHASEIGKVDSEATKNEVSGKTVGKGLAMNDRQIENALVTLRNAELVSHVDQNLTCTLTAKGILLVKTYIGSFRDDGQVVPEKFLTVDQRRVIRAAFKGGANRLQPFDDEKVKAACGLSEEAYLAVLYQLSRRGYVDLLNDAKPVFADVAFTIVKSISSGHDAMELRRGFSRPSAIPMRLKPSIDRFSTPTQLFILHAFETADELGRFDGKKVAEGLAIHQRDAESIILELAGEDLLTDLDTLYASFSPSFLEEVHTWFASGLARPHRLWTPDQGRFVKAAYDANGSVLIPIAISVAQERSGLSSSQSGSVTRQLFTRQVLTNDRRNNVVFTKESFPNVKNFMEGHMAMQPHEAARASLQESTPPNQIDGRPSSPPARNGVWSLVLETVKYYPLVKLGIGAVGFAGCVFIILGLLRNGWIAIVGLLLLALFAVWLYGFSEIVEERKRKTLDVPWLWKVSFSAPFVILIAMVVLLGTSFFFSWPIPREQLLSLFSKR